MARYTLPSLLQGHPPSQSSGTLMSLQEGIAEPCAHMVVLKPPAGRRSDLPCGVTAMPSTQYSILASCLRYLTRVFPLPVPAHSSHSEQPRFASQPRSRTHYSTCPEKGRELVGERPVCSVATSGCPTRSEDGFPVGARNIPPRPVQPSLTTTSNPKNKAPNHKVRGFWSG